jgi:hypothetical protein
MRFFCFKLGERKNSEPVPSWTRGRPGRDRMGVEITTTYAISAYNH